MEGAYDAIVVGSGFGGGVAACRLAEAGWRVCVLERGRRFAPGDFPDSLDDAPAFLWHRTLNPDGMLDVRLMRDLAVVQAAGVGGGSLVYSNVQLRAPADVFEQPAWPAGITRAGLDPYYDRTEEALQPRTTPDQPPLPKVRAFAAAARAIGREAELLPLAVHFGAEREHPFSGVRQQGCANLGRCNAGCPLHAKNTVDITYLARAESHGAEVRPHHEVTRLDPPRAPGGRWRVSYDNLGDGPDGALEAPVVVLAAGTLGSTKLLLENRRRLPHALPALGARFSGDGDALAAAFDPQAPGTRGAHTDYGPGMTSRVDYTAEHGFMLADGGLPTHFGGLLEVVREVDAITRWVKRTLLALKRLAARLGGGAQQLTPRSMPARPRRRIGDSLVFLLIGRDAGDGRIRLTPLLKRLDVRWSTRRSARLFDAMDHVVQELARGADATPFFGLEPGPLGRYATVHPLGGCPMADDPRSGVVDDAGKVHGCDGLYVLDGSIVPTALGVNPSKTIAALAERGVERLIAERTPASAPPEAAAS
jgi:cholesterol oxidase